MKLKYLYIIVFILTSYIVKGQELSKRVALNDLFMTTEYLGKSSSDKVSYRISTVVDMRGVDHVNHWLVEIKGGSEKVILSHRFDLKKVGSDLKISTSGEEYFVDPKEILLEGFYELPVDLNSGIYHINIVATDNSGLISNTVSQAFIIEDHD